MKAKLDVNTAANIETSKSGARGNGDRVYALQDQSSSPTRHAGFMLNPVNVEGQLLVLRNVLKSVVGNPFCHPIRKVSPVTLKEACSHIESLLADMQPVDPVNVLVIIIHHPIDDWTGCA